MYSWCGSAEIKQTHTVFSVAYKYNLLIVLKILSYTLYRKQLEEIERRAFSKIEQDSWSVPELAKMDQHYPATNQIKSPLIVKIQKENALTSTALVIDFYHGNQCQVCIVDTAFTKQERNLKLN